MLQHPMYIEEQSRRLQLGIVALYHTMLLLYNNKQVLWSMMMQNPFRSTKDQTSTLVCQ